MKLPIIISATHSATNLPIEYKRRCHLSRERLFRFSDPFTDYFSKLTVVSRQNRIKALCHRALCDLNRRRTYCFHTHDFDRFKLWRTGKELTVAEKNYIRKKYWDKFYQRIHNRIHSYQQSSSTKPILFIDLHNTSGRCPIRNRTHSQQKFMPAMILSNCGKSGTGTARPNKFITMPAQSMKLLQSCLEQTLPLSVEINEVYKGGYSIQHIYKLNQNPEYSRPIYCVQLEYNLDYIWNPLTKKLNQSALDILMNGLNKALHLFYRKLSHLKK